MKPAIFRADASKLNIDPRYSGWQQRIAALPLHRYAKTVFRDHCCIVPTVSRDGMESFIHKTNAQMAVFAQTTCINIYFPLSLQNLDGAGYCLRA